MAETRSTPKNYVKFIAERNRALEVLLNRTQAIITDYTRGTLTRVLEAIAARYGVLSHDSLMTPRSRLMIHSIDQELDQLFSVLASQILDAIVTLKRQAYTLSLVGEVEAIGRATGKVAQYHVDPNRVSKQAREGRDGEDLSSRIVLTLNRLKRQILNAVEMSVVQKETTAEALKRVYSRFPQKRIVKRPKKALRDLKEAEGDDKTVTLSQGFVSDEDWASIVEDYMDEYIPKYRGPETVFLVPDPDQATKQIERYGWEIEQETTENLVMATREAAKAAGDQNPDQVTDFVWIAIVDDKTDECCLWRDGLTSEEIEKELSGKHKNDEYDAIVPPCHYNCRCDLAPLLRDMPEKEPSNLADFEEWLNS